MGSLRMSPLTSIVLAAALTLCWTGGVPAVQGLTPVTPWETGFATFYGEHGLKIREKREDRIIRCEKNAFICPHMRMLDAADAMTTARHAHKGVDAECHTPCLLMCRRATRRCASL